MRLPKAIKRLAGGVVFILLIYVGWVYSTYRYSIQEARMLIGSLEKHVHVGDSRAAMVDAFRAAGLTTYECSATVEVGSVTNHSRGECHMHSRLGMHPVVREQVVGRRMIDRIGERIFVWCWGALDNRGRVVDYHLSFTILGLP